MRNTCACLLDACCLLLSSTSAWRAWCCCCHVVSSRFTCIIRGAFHAPAARIARTRTAGILRPRCANNDDNEIVRMMRQNSGILLSGICILFRGNHITDVFNILTVRHWAPRARPSAVVSLIDVPYIHTPISDRWDRGGGGDCALIVRVCAPRVCNLIYTQFGNVYAPSMEGSRRAEWTEPP